MVDGILAYIFFASIAFLGSAFINTLNWALISDAVEYSEWKTTIRSEGLVYSAYTFFRKISTAIAGFIPGVVLTLVGYVPNVQQTEEAINGIRGLIFLYPGALSILTIVVMYLGSPIWNTQYKKIITELTPASDMLRLMPPRQRNSP
ncbi:MAG: MFS transporter [Succinatimonas hippei]|nr:MFS transporter [Succinatimonas hippei]